MRKKSLISMFAAMGLVAAIGVGATLAFLSAETNTLTNTFTFTDQGIGLRLDEAKVENGVATDDRTTYDASEEERTQDYRKGASGCHIAERSYGNGGGKFHQLLCICQYYRSDHR